MPVEIQPYPGDRVLQTQLAQANKPWTFALWEEPHICVVLGQSNKLEREVHLDAIREDQLPVYRREGGGGSVVLSPGMLIIAVAAHVSDPYGSKRFFRLIQTPIIEALQDAGIHDVEQRGISDLAVHGRKILGSSMRRRASLLLYQAVLLVEVDRTMFSRYLQHPPKEPDYREGRTHESFTVSLQELGLQGGVAEIRGHLEAKMSSRLGELLSEDLLVQSSAGDDAFS